jgi:5-methylcytosine-specific restriction enzyme A
MLSTHRTTLNLRHTPPVHAPGFWCSWRTVCGVQMLHKHCMASDLTQLQPLQSLNSESWRAGKTTSAQRGYGYRWQQARERHLRVHPLCVICMEVDHVTAATVVDHKVPHEGDEAKFWDETNWQSLCVHHHSSHKQREEAGLR